MEAFTITLVLFICVHATSQYLIRVRVKKIFFFFYCLYCSVLYVQPLLFFHVLLGGCRTDLYAME